MKKFINIRREGNVIHIEKKQNETMDLRCSICGKIKNEDELKVDENGLYKCECGSSSFIPQLDIDIL